MNGVFLAYGNREEFLSTGVGKKVSSQIALFNKQGLNCELMMLECQRFGQSFVKVALY